MEYTLLPETEKRNQLSAMSTMPENINRASYYQEIPSVDVWRPASRRSRRPIEPDNHPRNAYQKWTYQEDCLLREMYNFGGSAGSISNMRRCKQIKAAGSDTRYVYANSCA